jgi:hypothetical protein
MKTHQNVLFKNIYGKFPHFTDVFDEETFIIFGILITLSSLLVAFILSRYITIRAVE